MKPSAFRIERLLAKVDLIGRASRFTAGAFGFLNLSQSFEHPEM
jgi:hypothetical protein